MAGLHFLRISAMKNQARANNTKILLEQPDFQDPPEESDTEFGRSKQWASDNFCMSTYFYAITVPHFQPNKI